MAKIGIVIGSLRKESFSKKVAGNVAKLFPEGYTTELIEIGYLPLYNEEYDDTTSGIHRLSVRVRAVNGFVRDARI